MKLFSMMIVALAVVISVTACEYKEQRTVQQPAPAPNGGGNAGTPGFCRLYAASSGDDDRLSLILRS